MDKESILKIIKVIQRSDEKDKEEHFKERYKNFKAKYPYLYKYACINDNIEVSFLDYMLSQIEKINNNESSRDDSSVRVGQMLFNKYVEPHVPNMKKKEGQ